MTASYTCLECGHSFESARPLHGESCLQCSSTLLEDLPHAAPHIPVGASVTPLPEDAVDDDLSSDQMKAMMGPTV